MEIVYEDSDLLVINKPPGLVVNRSETQRGRKTLQDWVDESLKLKAKSQKRQEGEFYERSGIVHRLDKDTSGLLVIAKTPEAFAELQRQFKEREVKKGYLALVHGRVEPPSGVIEKPIGRNPKDPRKFAVVEGGKEAVTEYRVVGVGPRTHLLGGSTLRSTPTTLLELKPRTGRTHQIRVHLKSLGHPVVGDKLYASRRQIREDKKFCPRQFLHAYRLGFSHPRTGEWLTFEVGLPEDLKDVLARLNSK